MLTTVAFAVVPFAAVAVPFESHVLVLFPSPWRCRILPPLVDDDDLAFAAGVDDGAAV